MEAHPPALIQWLVKVLTPPACREYVLGDLHERYRSPWLYARDAYRSREQLWPRAAATDALAAAISAFVSLTALAAIFPSGRLSPVQAFWDAFIPLFGLRMLWLPQRGNRPPYRERIRYAVVLAAWTILFAFAAILMVGVVSGFLFAIIVINGGSPAANPGLIATVGSVWRLAPVVGCALALLLGVVNRLPGTRLLNPHSGGSASPSI